MIEAAFLGPLIAQAKRCFGFWRYPKRKRAFLIELTQYSLQNNTLSTGNRKAGPFSKRFAAAGRGGILKPYAFNGYRLSTPARDTI
jgi:hypothetical protein